jgi:CBS domain-containing protein
MRVADIMTPVVFTMLGSASVAKAIKLMRDKEVRSLIVDRRYEEDAYGIVTETDIICKVAAYGRDPNRMKVYEIMTKPCIVVNPDLQVEYLARLFTQFNIRVAPVIEGQLLGIVSMTDILTKSDFAEAPQEVVLEQKIQEAIGFARNTCNEYGVSSKECMEAWSTVEHLQAEAAHQRAERLEKTALEEYSEEFPEVREAWMYDVWCSG